MSSKNSSPSGAEGGVIGKKSRKTRRQAETPTGIVLVDKPRGPTSRDVLGNVGRQLDLRGTGHCGTLDPLASGLLIVCSGFATRIQDLLMGHEKTYVADLSLGRVSATGDAEGPVEEHDNKDQLPSLGELERVIRGFEGDIEQTPPLHSAIRVGGERLYKKARRGESESEVEIPTRRVHIESIEVVEFEEDRARLTVRCGPGTYIRSLARDLGEALGCGAYLADLRRTRSGSCDVGDAKTPDQLVSDDIRPLEDFFAAHPRLELNDAEFAALLAGREVEDPNSVLGEDALAWHDGRVMARLRFLGDGRLRMKRLIRPDLIEART